MLDNGTKINVAGICVLLKDSKLPFHTDSTGFSNRSMATNLLLRGAGTLSIGENSNL